MKLLLDRLKSGLLLCPLSLPIFRMPYIPSLDQIEKAISVIQAGVDYIQKKRAERKARERAERHFLHDFTYVWSPHDDNSEEETIKSRCDSLINILRSHRHFLSGHGRKNAQIGHAHMAGLAFIMGAAFSTPPQSAIAGSFVFQPVLTRRNGGAGVSSGSHST